MLAHVRSCCLDLLLLRVSWLCIAAELLEVGAVPKLNSCWRQFAIRITSNLSEDCGKPSSHACLMALLIELHCCGSAESISHSLCE